MRVPFSKPYRALPEFEGVSREQCERALARAKSSTRSRPWRSAAAVVLGTLGTLVGVEMLWAMSGVAGWSLGRALNEPWALVLGAAGGLLAWALVRDREIASAMSRELARLRCRRCKQSLLGLPVHSRNIGAPDPADAWTRCPECGRVHKLLDLGLTPRDLIPFEQRDVPEDFARIRAPLVRGGHGAGFDDSRGSDHTGRAGHSRR